ncbi:MAG: hypothetical protein A2V77_08465 [Anaeromyxobacter sp. RBG_16_69_14]|nr:MAG: hypothetical protein A2V77_08465 [Anaeromyxobacter sp. RBG_16_69_14]
MISMSPGSGMRAIAASSRRFLRRARITDQVREAGAAVATDLERAVGAQGKLGGGEVVVVRSRRRAPYCIAASVGATAFVLGATFARFVGR